MQVEGRRFSAGLSQRWRFARRR